MKILLLGQGGQVGWELQRALAPLGEVIGLDRHSRELHADLGQPEALAATVRAVRPDVIVNAAAHTAVDKAESEPALAQAINADAPGVLAREAAALGATLLHYSTDYVFDGSGHAPRDEDAATAPLSVYGRSKLGGEQQIQASGCRHLILRTSWVYAARGGNFAKTMLRLAAEREALNVIDDQIGAPTGAELLADVSAQALRTLQQRPELAGLYHCVAGGEVSWHGYARHVIEWARAQGRPIKVAPEAIRPIPTSQYPTPAQRPLNSRLDTRRLQAAFGLVLPHWQTGVERMLAELP
ncbi:dTDP-4-dehydrorhamnose reductase [Ideonella sp. 4Y11]|uniref:dTDP-4-dehydrorhamnose reductase n=1 Tax=Ideonella aquatica TaxID=2824119 RepID=A0A940YFH0_9BURK|nr:dTDP-4-dehydrorhamnose reductase [Ideonella aquatica]MBQ0958359.1 dTDP-4-dehydrorhamnose reductase [Ideonella aquatica]